nr:NADH dehydrogenase subunit 1 [Frankliniella intonsa]
MFNFLLILSLLSMILTSLVAVAFITLLERKILGYMQIRLGPNKTSFLGMLQPMSDAIKLYTKEIAKPYSSNFMSFFFSPSLSLMLALMLWFSLPIFKPFIIMNMGLLMFMAILGMGVYPILMAGWSSNSNFSLIGGMRALAQTISYEVSLIFIILSNMILNNSMDLFKTICLQKSFMFLMFFFNFILWMISCIAEVNRTPFDFAEGESELVSGFNTEYSSGIFAMIFMAEYMMIIFFSTFSSMMFLGFSFYSVMFFISLMAFNFTFIWLRATLPRYRYDLLMNLSWKKILPASTFNIFFFNFLNLVTK